MKSLGPILIMSAALTVIAGCGSGGGGSGGINDIAGPEDIKLSLQKISDSTTDSAKPAVAANADGSVYVAWEEATTGLTKEIYLAYSVNSGDKFFPIAGAGRTFCSTFPPVSEDFSMKAGDDGSLYLAWIEKWPDVSRVMFYSDPSSCHTLSATTSGSASSPRFVMDGIGGVDIVWTGTDSGNKEINFSRSSNGGKNFSSPLNVSKSPASDSSEPLLAVEGSYNVLKAVWVEGGEGSRGIVSSKFIDGPGDFLSFEPLSVTSTESYCPVIASSFDATYLAYKGDHKIHFSLWDPITLSFSKPVALFIGAAAPSCPQITTGSNGTIYVVWSYMNSVWVTASTDNGVTFPSLKEITPAEGVSSSPGIASTDSEVGIVWEGVKGGNKEIFFSVSTDNGKTFSSPKNLSNSAAPSSSPAIATDTKKFFYVAWEEGAEGDREIYFLKYSH